MGERTAETGGYYPGCASRDNGKCKVVCGKWTVTSSLFGYQRMTARELDVKRRHGQVVKGVGIW